MEAEKEHRAGEGLSEGLVLTAPRLAGHQDPSTSPCNFRRHPDLEAKNNDRVGQGRDTDHRHLQKGTQGRT